MRQSRVPKQISVSSIMDMGIRTILDLNTGTGFAISAIQNVRLEVSLQTHLSVVLIGTWSDSIAYASLRRGSLMMIVMGLILLKEMRCQT